MIEKNPERGDSSSASRDRNLKLASLAGYLALGGAAVVTVMRHEIVGVGLAAQAVQLVGFALMIWARVTFRMRSFHLAANPTEGGLVTTGPYRFVRHPVYAAALLVLAPAVVTHPSLFDLGLLALALVGVAVRVVAEEHLVTARYPAYVEYAQRTKRLVPFVL